MVPAAARRATDAPVRPVVAVLLAALLAACAARSTQPAPGEVQPAPAAATAAPRRHTEADVRFVQGMIAHHRQALAMTALVPARSSRQDIRLLAERIEVSQQDEIAQMRRWLGRRGESVPGADAHHGHHDASARPAMPGMLTAEEMARLEKASGADFDRLFLELMIKHHEGALAMVKALLATPGAAQETETFQLASDVDADQRAEIRRMRALLDALPPAARRP
jgi:uncharacterized protein (DUF305 family)